MRKLNVDHAIAFLKDEYFCFSIDIEIMHLQLKHF